jgi:hypothetical protein
MSLERLEDPLVVERLHPSSTRWRAPGRRTSSAPRSSGQRPIRV